LMHVFCVSGSSRIGKYQGGVIHTSFMQKW
jgi:hypothetical protein